MRFTVAPAIFERFPGMRIAVVVAPGVDNRRAVPAIDAIWREAWADAGRLADIYGNAQSHPRVRAWRKRFRTMGVSSKEFPSSIEAMLRRAFKGGEPFVVNPLVDFYNAMSLRHVVPAGGFDLAELGGPLELRLARPGDRFAALDATESLMAPAGEVAYADGETILTRHFVWRQARAGLVTPASREVVLVSEVLGEIEPAVATAVLDELADGVRTCFDCSPRSFVIDEQCPEVAW